jgi:hypothetical protein
VAKVQKYWPMVLSGTCLAATVYFTLTDKAYVLEGCPVEAYPELGFFFVIGPAALLALMLAVRVGFANLSARSRRTSLIASVALCVVCLALTAVSIWPTSGSCH